MSEEELTALGVLGPSEPLRHHTRPILTHYCPFTL